MSPSSAVSPARSESQSAVAAQSRPRANYITEKIRTNGSACFRVLGESMFPWIRSGDFAFVRRADFESASADQVVLYERGKRLFVHRVLRRRRIAASSSQSGSFVLITKGGALDAKDAPVSEAEFLGRITRIHRGQRHIDLEFLGRILFGKFLAFVSPASFILYRPDCTRSLQCHSREVGIKDLGLVFNLNVFSVVRLSRAVLPRIRKQKASFVTGSDYRLDGGSVPSI